MKSIVSLETLISPSAYKQRRAIIDIKKKVIRD
jgi:hypothetical protein